MKIAQIMPNWGDFHKGTALGIIAVARDVTVGLTKRGHTVTAFVPDNSTFSGIPLVFGGPSLWSRGMDLFHPDSPKERAAYARRILPYLDGYDIVHSHIEHVLLPMLDQIGPPVVSTIHGAGFNPKEQDIFQQYPGGVFVALSERAKESLSYIHFSYVVYNGVNISQAHFVPVPQPPSYVAWMGRMVPEKGALDAIEVGKRTGETVVLIGLRQAEDPVYDATVNALVDGAKVRLIERMIGIKRFTFLGNAKALLFPIHWEEPFGLVMTEAMACGTPVVAFARGSVAEVVVDGVTGFIVNSGESDKRGDWIVKKTGIEGLVDAVNKINNMDEIEYEQMRINCRKHVEGKFTVEKMVEGYERVYKNILKK
jgi:glycosyltransferase involved in cell wall biosynthesis